jgi:hypothetical protein
MSTIKKDIRTNQALQVVQHTNNGLTIIEACREVGIPRSTFYYFVDHNPDIIATFQEMKMWAIVQEFMLILDNQIKVLERVIADGLSAKTKPRQRLAIYKQLTKRMDELLAELPTNREDDSDIMEIFSGPKLVPGISRFSGYTAPTPMDYTSVTTSGSA